MCRLHSTQRPGYVLSAEDIEQIRWLCWQCTTREIGNALYTKMSDYKKRYPKFNRRHHIEWFLKLKYCDQKELLKTPFYMYQEGVLKFDQD